MIPDEWLDQAVERVRGRVLRTPLTYDPDLDVYFKWENHQTTGSFKLRGAMNKILALTSYELERGLAAASAGNHGQGVALAAQAVGAHVTVFASEHAVPNKLAAMRALGAEVRLVPGGYSEAEAAGLRFSQESGATWVSPYNDGLVIAGQATLGVELLDDRIGREVNAWVVPVGGGGLIAGLGAALRRTSPRPRLIGVQSEASAYFHSLFHNGSQAGVVEVDSLADGLSGAVEEGSITIPLVRRSVDDIRLVSEDEISRAIACAWTRYGERIEGSAAVALAGVLFGHVAERPALVVVSGGNIPDALFEAALKTGGCA